MCAGVRLRPARADDLGFLVRLYSENREGEFRSLPWSEDQIAGFLAQQFDLQHEQLLARFPDAAFLIVEKDGRPVGRLYLDASAGAFHIVEIGLLAAERGQGLGRRLLDWVETRAISTGAVRMHLSVAPWNAPALGLYTSFGFEVVAESQTWLALEKRIP